MVEPLTQEERDRFAAWLEDDAEADTELAETMEKAQLPFSGEWRKNAAAKKRVAWYLRLTESTEL